MKLATTITTLFAILRTFSSTIMHPSNNIASQLDSPRPRLYSLNGSSNSSDVTTATRRSNNSTAATFCRGTKNRNNLNTMSDQEDQKSQQKCFLSHDHLNDDNRRMDLRSNNGLPSPLAQHMQTDHDVRYDYNRSSSSPPLSSSINSSFADRSFTTKRCNGMSSIQKLDSFLDLYEQKHGLEPLEKNQVQGLSADFNMASLLSRLITVSSQDRAFYKKTEQILQKDSQKMPIPSTFSSLDLSWLPAAALSQDDIQDKSLSNNNNSKDILNIQLQKQPLSPIKERPRDFVKSILRKNVTKSRYHDQAKQNELKDDTIYNTNKIATTIKMSQVDFENAEVGSGGKSFTGAAVRKTSGLKRVAFTTTPPPPQQPQHIDNSKTAIVTIIGDSEEEGKRATNREGKTISDVAPEQSTTEFLGKLPIEKTPSKATASSVLRNTVVAQRNRSGVTGSSASLVRKSKIPVPLPKTKTNITVKTGITCRSSASTSSKICNHSQNNENDSTAGNNMAEQVQTRTAVEKVETPKIRNNANHNIVPLKKQFLPHSNNVPTPVSGTTLQTNSDLNSNTCISNNLKELPRRKIGEGDEISECLSLIDGLSGHTTWVMNKVLQFPLSDEDAIKRMKTLKECPGIGDFFGVPYVQKEVLAHLFFSNGCKLN